MNTRQLECFIHAASNLNFREAAKKLFISQPAVTYQIKSLERELGFPLFQRNSNRVVLTPAGESFYQGSAQVLAALSKAIETAQALSEPQSRRIILTWPPSIFDREMVSMLVEEYTKIHPEIAFDISISEQLDTNKVTGESPNDIVFTLREDLSDISGCTTHPLFEIEQACQISPVHPLAEKKSITWDDVRTQNVLLVPEDYHPNTYGTFLNVLKKNIPAEQIHYYENTAIIEIHIAAGKGVCFRPVRQSIMHSVVNGIKYVPFRPPLKFHVVIAYSKFGDVNMKREFSDFSTAFCSQ